MPVLSEDFSRNTLQEVMLSMAENRARHKELRVRLGALVDTKLAKKISPEEYAVQRKRFNEDITECRSRTMILTDEILRRR